MDNDKSDDVELVEKYIEKNITGNEQQKEKNSYHKMKFHFLYFFCDRQDKQTKKKRLNFAELTATKTKKLKTEKQKLQ